MRPVIPEIEFFIYIYIYKTGRNLLSVGLRQGLTCSLFDILFIVEVGCRMSDVIDVKVKREMEV
jgi:hypothetical protein